MSIARQFGLVSGPVLEIAKPKTKSKQSAGAILKEDVDHISAKKKTAQAKPTKSELMEKIAEVETRTVRAPKKRGPIADFQKVKKPEKLKRGRPKAGEKREPRVTISLSMTQEDAQFLKNIQGWNAKVEKMIIEAFLLPSKNKS